MELEKKRNLPIFSDYIVYVDESGDHSLQSINPDYPYFVLAFCIFKKSDYITQVVPELQLFGLEPIFAHKQNNSAGLQFADLVARPIGRHVMQPDQQNRSFDILSKKLYRVAGSYLGWGLNISP